MKIINKIVHSIKEPEDHYIYWFDEKSKEIKYYSSTEGWTPIVPVEDYLTQIKEDILYIKDDIRISKDEMVLKLDSINNSILELAENASNAILAIEEELDTTVRKIESILYDELVHKVENGELVPGQFYRIIDFVTTTKESSNYTSAEHQFDIIVKALDAYTLSEDAEAIHHEDDAYFSNSKLSAWTLKYNIYNDTNKFNWARREVYTVSGNTIYNFEKAYDTTTVINTTSGPVTIVGYVKGSYIDTEYILPKDNIYAGGGLYYYKYTTDSTWSMSGSSISHTPNGKGVIYYMKDEFDNEAPYDFKNILYKEMITYTPEIDTRELEIQRIINTDSLTLINKWGMDTYYREDIPVFSKLYQTNYTFSTIDGEDKSLNNLCAGNKIVRNAVSYPLSLPNIIFKTKGTIKNNVFDNSRYITIHIDSCTDNKFINCEKCIIRLYNTEEMFTTGTSMQSNTFIKNNGVIFTYSGALMYCDINNLAESMICTTSHIKGISMIGEKHEQIKISASSIQNITLFGNNINITAFGGYLLYSIFHSNNENLEIPIGSWTERFHFLGVKNLRIEYTNSGAKFYNSIYYPSDKWPLDPETSYTVITGNTDKNVSFEYKNSDSQVIML